MGIFVLVISLGVFLLLGMPIAFSLGLSSVIYLITEHGFSMLVMTLPIVYPVVIKLGFNSLWFGVFLVIMIEMAQITPPVGFNLFVIQGISGRDLNFVVKSTFPFFCLF